MRNFAIEDKLQKILNKLYKKDREAYNAIMNKIQEILTCEDVNHYKNLKRPLQEFKRAHIMKFFVLTFKYLRSEDKVVFFDFDHNDKIYNKF